MDEATAWAATGRPGATATLSGPGLTLLTRRP